MCFRLEERRLREAAMQRAKRRRSFKVAAQVAIAASHEAHKRANNAIRGSALQKKSSHNDRMVRSRSLPFVGLSPLSTMSGNYQPVVSETFQFPSLYT
eukprot:scaffold115401_cov38-Prasinocladus_malaysianus.AAC.1